jgi:hypothetical protein
MDVPGNVNVPVDVNAPVDVDVPADVSASAAIAGGKRGREADERNRQGGGYRQSADHLFTPGLSQPLPLSSLGTRRNERNVNGSDLLGGAAPTGRHLPATSKPDQARRGRALAQR